MSLDVPRTKDPVPTKAHIFAFANPRYLLTNWSVKKYKTCMISSSEHADAPAPITYSIVRARKALITLFKNNRFILNWDQDVYRVSESWKW